MPLRAGFRDEGVIDVALWVAAFDTGSLVGLCDRRGCMGALKVAPTVKGEAFEVVDGLAWFETRCLRCEHVATFPNGRTRTNRPRPRTPKKPTPKAYAAARAHLRALAHEASAYEQRRLGEKDD